MKEDDIIYNGSTKGVFWALLLIFSPIFFLLLIENINGKTRDVEFMIFSIVIILIFLFIVNMAAISTTLTKDSIVVHWFNKPLKKIAYHSITSIEVCFNKPKKSLQTLIIINFRTNEKTVAQLKHYDANLLLSTWEALIKVHPHLKTKENKSEIRKIYNTIRK